jgi:hypothetical protein
MTETRQQHPRDLSARAKDVLVTEDVRRGVRDFDELLWAVTENA